MSKTARAFLVALSAGLASAAWHDGAAAQSGSTGCTVEQIGGTARHLVRCRGGLSVTLEKDTDYSLLDRNGNGTVDAMRQNGKAALIELQKGSSEGFEVISPQAIAAVRGTRWVVDVGADQTSVFVIEGSVKVSRSAGGGSVALGAGDGVDVTGASGELIVKRWAQKRVTALLARFGE